MGFDEFEDDEKTVDSVLRNFEIIDEASKYVPGRIQKIYPDVP